MFRFPLGTVKKIAKLDPDLHMASQVTDKSVNNNVADLSSTNPFYISFLNTIRAKKFNQHAQKKLCKNKRQFAVKSFSF